MTPDDPESLFRRQVDRWTLAAVRHGVEHFEGLLSALPGVYPPIAAASLTRLCQQGTIPPNQYRQACARRPRDDGGPIRCSPPALPPPHPLDFDWRYTERTVDRLLHLAAGMTDPGDTIALLGTPSVYAAALDQGFDRKWVLLEGSEATVQRLQSAGPRQSVQLCDVLRGDIPELGAAAVVADPPWYPGHIEAFLWAATACVRQDAAIVMSLPPMGTRPGIASERRGFRSAVTAHGLEMKAIRRNWLTYTTPPFERNALLAAGWDDPPVDWRRGDIAILRDHGSTVGPRPCIQPSSGDWDEVMLGWTRIRVLPTASGHEFDPSLQPLVPGNVLDDVSSRNPVRDKVNVWTSGNRIYHTRAPEAVLAMLKAMATGSNARDAATSTIGRVTTRAEERAIARTVRQLSLVTGIEARELARYGWATDVGVRAKRAS
jgi:hypothetical protein